MIVEPKFDVQSKKFVWTVEVDDNELAILTLMARRRECTLPAVIAGILKTEIAFFVSEENGHVSSKGDKK